MLEFIKKLFLKEELPEERIDLNNLNSWMDDKTKPIIEDLNINIKAFINKINDEKKKVFENIKKLEIAKLQNPNIPERVKTIMEGNRAAFIKKVSFFFDNIDLDWNDHNKILDKSKKIKKDIEILGKGTMRSFQVLNEFFAREVGIIAVNIKNIENYSNELVKSIRNSKILTVEKIRNNIVNIQNKIRLKNGYAFDLENNNKNLQNNKNKKLEIENEIIEIKSGKDYNNYEKLLEEKDNVKVKINKIESQLFHDFSVLEKALKKYAKVAFENEKLILEYLNNPFTSLIKDNELKILKIIDNLKIAIERNELDLDEKKGNKAIEKINELDSVYFTKITDDFKNARAKLIDIKNKIENNNSKKDLDILNMELININRDIENLNNIISNTNNELGKMNIEKLKEELVKNITDLTNLKITIS